MPARSKRQLGLIYSKRNKYGSRKNTPKKWKWVWGKEWTDVDYKKLPEKTSEHIITKFDYFLNEGIRDVLKPKSKEEIGDILKKGKQTLEITNGYTTKQAKNIIRKYSKLLNNNFTDNPNFRGFELFYKWTTPSNIIVIILDKSDDKYILSLSDNRHFSLKKIKKMLDFSNSSYAFVYRKTFYYLDHALEFLNDCNIDTTKITKK